MKNHIIRLENCIIGVYDLKEKKKKKVTMKDISEKLNISINAVSLALNDRVGVSDNTRSEVFRTAAELGYFDENPSLIGGNISKNICIMIEKRNFTDINFYSKVILGIENETRKNNYDIIVNFIDRNNFSIPSAVENRKVCGILIVGTIEDIYLKKILSFGLPVVLVDYTSYRLSVDSIMTQNIAGSYKAADYLISRGHKCIGFFGNINSSLSYRERWIGFCERLKQNRLSDMLENSLTGTVDKYVFEKDYTSIANMIKSIHEIPTAWVCSNDTEAMALYYALDLLDYKVPEDISVIGFDDIDLCTMMSPNLTTMRVYKELMGQKAVKRLIWRMENKNEPSENIRLGVSLVERESVK